MQGSIAAASALLLLCASLPVLAQAPATTPQPQPELQPQLRPDPLETPIGTEANAPPIEPLRRITKPVLPKSIVFKVGTWNLAAKKTGDASAAVQPQKAPRKAWRHTFGAERTTAEWREIGKGNFAADIIALQGVTSSRTIRRLFNARHYHVVVSRQQLAPSTSNSTGFAVFRADAPPTTALAFRRRRGVRIAGFRHFLPQAVKQQPEAPAITAFRIRIYRKMLWVASADIPMDCRADVFTDACRHHAEVLNQFTTWAGQQVARQQAPFLLLGQWPEAVVERFKNIGMDPGDQAEAAVDCNPAPGPMRLFVPAATATTTAVNITNPKAAEDNPCAATSDLTVMLQ